VITVVSVEWGGYQGRAIEYIDKLKASVARHLEAQHWFCCLRLDSEPVRSEESGERGNPSPLTPHPSPVFGGWFRKLEIFRPGRFTGRVLYLDLDSVIVGALDPLAYRKGAVHLKDWGWKDNVHFGGVWSFDAEQEGRRIWEAYNDSVPANFKDDQDWLTSLGIWGPLPPHLVRSYRYHCSQNSPPPGASVVAFHGRPKPHEMLTPWVKEAWRL
jgi:hypothetical protein